MREAKGARAAGRAVEESRDHLGRVVNAVVVLFARCTRHTEHARQRRRDVRLKAE